MNETKKEIDPSIQFLLDEIKALKEEKKKENEESAYIAAEKARLKKEKEAEELAEQVKLNAVIAATPKINLAALSMTYKNVNGLPVLVYTGVSDWDGLSRDIIADLNLFSYNGVYVYKNKNGEVVTLEEDPKEIIRKHTAKLIPNIPPSLNKTIADGILDRVDEIEVELDDKVVYFNNGEFNSETGKFTPQTNPAFNHRRLPWGYIEPANLMKTHKTALLELQDTLKKISDGDEKVLRQVMQMIGATLLPTRQFGKAFFLLGSGRNGKSTLLNMVAKLHGEGKIARLPLEAMSGQRASFTMIGLVNKSVNIIDDISYISVKENGLFKSMIAGEGLNAEVKGGRIFNFYNEATIIAGCNNMPNFADKGQSTATMDRTVIIPLNHKFNRDAAGAKIAERLKQDDVIEALASLACGALYQAKTAGLVESERTKDAMEEMELEQDSVKYWLHNAEPFSNATQLPTFDTYMRYESYVKAMGRQPVSEINFGRSLVKHVPNLVKKRLMNEGKRVNYYVIEQENLITEDKESNLDL